jgi:hypothetical protein
MTGYACYVQSFHVLSPDEPIWLANPLVWLGCFALWFRKSLWAGVLGLTAVGLVLASVVSWTTLFSLGGNFVLGSEIWLASMVLLAVAGFYEWRKPRLRLRSPHAKVIMPEIDTPASPLDAGSAVS